MIPSEKPKEPTDSEKKRKVYIRTYGCQMNEYDSQKLLKILEPEYQPSTNVADADLVLVNTCSVRGKPEHKLYSLLGELRELKEQNPKLMIGVGGCVAQQEGDRITKRSRDVNFVFGTHNLSLVPSLIERSALTGLAQVAVDYRDEWEELPLGFPESGRVVQFVSISRGCNKNCTYCIVPKTRGPEISRAVSEIEREIKIAVSRGVKEVVLLGQTVNSFGLDLVPKISFIDLLNRISEIQGLERIRFTSPHPQEVRKDFIDLVCSNPKICRHIHMPLQSGSDRILKLMNRNYRRSKYLKIIDSLKSRVPDMAITTDIIVGFPGETEADFEQTLDICRHVRFDDSFSFVYSPRPDTKAALMEDVMPYKEKLVRLQELQAYQKTLTLEALNKWIGKDVQILIDSKSQYDHDKLQGRSSQNKVVNLTEHINGVKIGDLINCRITSSGNFTLRGEVVSVYP